MNGLLLLGILLLSPMVELRSVELADGVLAPARFQILDDSGWLFTDPDSLRRHRMHAELGAWTSQPGSLVVDLAVGPHELILNRGIFSISEVIAFDPAVDPVVEGNVGAWVEPDSFGQRSWDPHLHLGHGQGADYPPLPTAAGVMVARSEGLDLVHALENDPTQPSGLMISDSGTRVEAGEEYRNGFWGHVVLVGLDSLLTGPSGPGCCGLAQPAWPSLSKILASRGDALAILAHPKSTHDPTDTGAWPGGGVGREFWSLLRTGAIDAMAIASASNGGNPWALEDWFAAQRMGIHLPVVGEGDRALDRHMLSPPGQPRTMVFAAPGGETQALREGRSYATTGPFLESISLGGVELGGSLRLSPGESSDLEFVARSAVPLDSIRIHRQRETLSLPWPMGETRVELRLPLVFEGSDFVVVELWGSQRWPGLVHDPRLVSSAMLIKTGWPSAPPQIEARRAVDELSGMEALAVVRRGFATSADSLALHLEFEAARTWYEIMADDPPGDFQLLWPSPGEELPSSGGTFRWERSLDPDGDPVQYQFRLFDFNGALTQSVATAESLVAVEGLLSAETYDWSVTALSGGGVTTDSTPLSSTFSVSGQATSVGERPSALQLHSGAMRAGATEIRLYRDSPAQIQLVLHDLRGRVVWKSSLWLDGEARRWLRGEDGRGRPLARGSYILRAWPTGRADESKSRPIQFR